MILTDPAHISERKNPATREDPTETCCWRLSKACLCSWESFLAGQASGEKNPHKCFPHVCASINHKVWVTHRDIESCHLPKHPNQTSWFCSKKCPPNMKKANWSLRRTQERKTIPLLWNEPPYQHLWKPWRWAKWALCVTTKERATGKGKLREERQEEGFNNEDNLIIF